MRVFLPTPVPRETVADILTRASRAPSGGNLQPWRVYVMAGPKLEGFIATVKSRMPTTPRGEGAEYNIYPPELKDPYAARRFKVGEDMYASLGIPREDKKSRLLHFLRNFEFFGAPVGMIITLDRSMQPGQWSDVGMFLNSVMLLARERGLHTAAQEAWAVWHKTIREVVGVPEHEIVFCGLALGYADEGAAINCFETERAPLEAFADFRLFEAS